MSGKTMLSIGLVVVVSLALALTSHGLIGQARGGTPGAAAPASAPSAAGQRGGGGAGTAPTPAGGGLPGSVLDYMGPTGDIPATAPLDRGVPKAPSTDTYYYDRPFSEMPPDEFLSNPDSEFDWHDLKAWHVPPLLKSVKIIGNRKVRPGESVTLEAEISDPTGTTAGATLSYYGPHGRRTTVTATFRPIQPGSNILRGTFTVPQYAEPGVYRHIRFGINNEVRSAKAYFSDYHPAMRGQPLEIEVLSHANADVVPPVMHWFKVGSIDAPDGVVPTYDIKEPIFFYARVTDNKSGVDRIWARINKRGSPRFQEVDLKPMMGQQDVYVGTLTMPEWWEGGEYQVMMVNVEDRARQEIKHFFSSNDSVGKAKYMIRQDPARVDNTPPKLISIWVEGERGAMGQPVTVNAIMVDDKSGVGTLSAVFQSVPSFQNNGRAVLRKPAKSDVVQRAGLNTEQNLYTGQFTTSIWQEPGRWQLLRIVARDNADNYLDMLASDNPQFEKVAIELGGGQRLRERMLQGQSGAVPMSGAGGGGGSAMAAAPGPASPAQAVSAQPGKIRRVDMTPPHPPRGACLNCHEP